MRCKSLTRQKDASYSKTNLKYFCLALSHFLGILKTLASARLLCIGENAESKLQQLRQSEKLGLFWGVGRVRPDYWIVLSKFNSGQQCRGRSIRLPLKSDIVISSLLWQQSSKPFKSVKLSLDDGTYSKKDLRSQRLREKEKEYSGDFVISISETRGSL